MLGIAVAKLLQQIAEYFTKFGANLTIRMLICLEEVDM